MAEDPLVDAVDDELDPDRVTLGQRIAGIKQPAYMPTTPSGADTAPAPSIRPQIDPNSLPESVRPYQLKPADVPQAGSKVPELAKEQARLSTPIDPYNRNAEGGIAGTKPQYRMGVGQRILGTVGNFLSGMGGKGPVTYVGPGATNWRFGREEAARQGQLEGVNTQIKTQEQMDTENEKLQRDAIRQAYEGQLGEARLGTSAAQKETADVRQQLEGANKNLLEEKANKLANATPPEPKTEAELALAYQTAQQKGDKQAAARYRGALDELARQKKAGRDTTTSDVSKAIQVAEYRGKEHDRIDNEQEQERNRRYAEVDKNVQMKYDAKKSAAAKAQIDADLKTKYDPKHQNVDSESDKMLGITKSGGPLKSNANKPAATPAPPPKVGATVRVKQKDGSIKTGKVVGFNPNKKPIVDYSGQ